jgi:hypothetical protein
MSEDTIDLGIEREKYDYPMGDTDEPKKRKKKVKDYPEFTVRDKAELFDTPEEEFEAIVTLKRCSREERPDYDDPDKKRLYVGFKIHSIKPLGKKKKEKKMASPKDYEVDFSDLEKE